MKLRKWTLIATGAALIIGFAFVELSCRSVVAGDVIGNRKRNCHLSDHHPIANASGTVAVLREADCPDVVVAGTGYYVVFVHRRGEPNDRDNLVLQYEIGFDNYTAYPPPIMKWTGARSLAIRVPGIAAAVERRRSHIGNIQVSYSLRVQH